jgi:hypothetical protein
VKEIGDVVLPGNVQPHIDEALGGSRDRPSTRTIRTPS